MDQSEQTGSTEGVVLKETGGPCFQALYCAKLTGY